MRKRCKVFTPYMLIFCILFSCKNTQQKPKISKKANDPKTSRHADSKPVEEKKNVDFERFLALFEKNASLAKTNCIIIPPNDNFFKNDALKNMIIPKDLLEFVDIDIDDFEILKSQYKRFNASVEKKNPFYVIIKFNVYVNILSVVVLHIIPEAAQKNTASEIYFVINYDKNGDIISTFPVAYYFSNDTMMVSCYSNIYSASYIEQVEHISKIYETKGEESITGYSISITGEIKQAEERINNLAHFTSDWLYVTDREGEQYIQYYCEAMPQSITIIKKNNTYELIHSLGQDSRSFTIVSFRSYPHLNRYDFILKSEYQDEERQVYVTPNENEKNLALWEGLSELEEKQNFAAKKYVESGNIKVKKEKNCDE